MCHGKVAKRQCLLQQQAEKDIDAAAARLTNEAGPKCQCCGLDWT